MKASKDNECLRELERELSSGIRGIEKPEAPGQCSMASTGELQSFSITRKGAILLTFMKKQTAV